MDVKKILHGGNPYADKLDKPEKAEMEAKVRAARARANTGSEADKVSVSSEGKLVGEAATTARRSDGVRSELVARLKAEIASGTYQPDSRKIAEKMLKEEIDLFR